MWAGTVTVNGFLGHRPDEVTKSESSEKRRCAGLGSWTTPSFRGWRLVKESVSR